MTIIGAGLAGTLMAILLARRNVPVRLLERRPDPRLHVAADGRSINLALAARGIAALRYADVFASVEPLLLPMSGRMLHDADGNTRFVPYGQNVAESIYSVSRSALNRVLLDQLEKLPGVVVGFQQECLAVDFDERVLEMRGGDSGRSYRLPLEHVIAADGAGSAIRQSMIAALNIEVADDPLPHGYKELTLPAAANGNHQLDPRALHIWPRGGFMLIALPNTDRTFTLTLFLPLTGADSFSALEHSHSVHAFFARQFPDTLELLPNLTDEFMSHPTGHMGTIRCPQWTAEGRVVLLGDAAHTLVPFHGQGMNCAFEDCVELDSLLSHLEWPEACRDFEARRRPNAEAIAQMALENYVEMRDTVRDPRFQLQKALSLELERRFPHRFIPRYSMVMFHHEIPYSLAYERGQVQLRILERLTQGAETLDAIDFSHAARLIEDVLPPLPKGNVD